MYYYCSDFVGCPDQLFALICQSNEVFNNLAQIINLEGRT